MLTVFYHSERRYANKSSLIQFVAACIVQILSCITECDISQVYFHVKSLKRNLSGDAYAFLALLKAADQVDATEAVTPIGGRTMRVNTVQFNGRILFTNMPLDFTVTVEIYALVCAYVLSYETNSVFLLLFQWFYAATGAR